MSRVAFVVCFKAVTAELWAASKPTAYSFIEDSGDRSFEITVASKKFPLDSQRVSNLVSFWASASVETVKRSTLLIVDSLFTL